ncbi:YbaN family protein [Kaarinaea lacus]
MKITASKPIRYLLILAGMLSVALGVVGIFLPLLPTTPFMLLAAACFAQSSPRFHQALLESRLFGPIIKQWQEQRSIPKKSKNQAIFLVVVVFTISIVFFIQDSLARALMVAMAAVLIGFLLRIPSAEPNPIN